MPRSPLTSLAVAASSVAFTAAALAGAEADLLALAKSNVDKFATELPNLPTSMTLRFSPAIDPIKMARFDSEQQTLVLEYSPLNIFSAQTVWEKCKAAGSFIGRNAFGTKAKVQLNQCESLEISDGEGLGARFGDTVVVPMTPDQYRSLKKSGLVYEVVFSVGEGVKSEVFTRSTHVFEATVSSPRQINMTVYGAVGRIKSLTLLTAQGKALLPAIERQK